MKKFKKLLVATLAAILVLTMLPISAVATDTTATAETETEWIPIGTAEEFRKIGVDTAYPVTGSYYLTGDIDFSDSEGDPISVAYLIENFSGVLDGKGYTLKGFKINSTDKGGVIMKAAASGNVIIRNLNIGTAENKIEATVTGTATSNFGFLVAENSNKAWRITIENVDVYGNATVTATGTVRAGGFIGWSRDITVVDSSFNGSITVNSSAATEKNVGGLIAILPGESKANRSAVIKDCTVNADISQGTATNGSERVGGIVGYAGFSTLVDDCTVNGNLTGTDNVGGIAGVVGNYTLFVATDCTVTGNQTGSNKGVIYGWQDNNVVVERIYIRGCAEQNTEARDFGDFGNGFDPAKQYVWLIDEEADFAKIGSTVEYTDADGATQSYKYSGTGFYRFENDIVMKDAAYTNGPVNCVFGGVFDGNGYSVKNLTLNDASGDAGFFAGIGHTTGGDDTVIMDVSFGAADSYIQMTTAQATGGVIAGYAGHAGGTNANYSVIFNGVDVYANVTHTRTGKTNFGGFVGLNRRVNYYDCNMHGSLTSTVSMASQPNGDNYINMGAFCSTVEVDKFVAYNCNNYANVTVHNKDTNNNGNDKSRASGFVAYSAYAMSFVDCNNFGIIDANGDASIASTQAGGLIANTEGSSATAAVGCANYGKVISKDYAAGVSALNRKPLSVGEFGQFGTVSAAKAHDISVGDDSVTTDNIYAVDTVSEKSVTMNVGASIRLASETGIRFMGFVSVAAVEMLQESFGADAVSYGVLIAPMAFVNAAGGATHGELDTYATAQNGFAEGEKAYVDVVAEDWFKGETGKIAGSIIKLPVARYNTGFTGVAYIDVNGYKIYADAPQTRSISYVAQKAIDDVLYKDANGKLWVRNDEGSYVEYTESDADTYTNELSVEGDYTVLTCYSDEDRATLNNILNPQSST